MIKKQYENVFTANNKLYARVYDTETKESQLSQVDYVPSIFMKNDTGIDTGFKSIITKESLKEISFKNEKEYKDSVNIYKSSGMVLYGNKSREQGYIRENFGNPLDNNHDFHLWCIDIETMVDKTDPDADKKMDWKPTGHLRAAKGIITSIQIYDTKHKEFYIFGLKKDWNNDNNFESPHGKINYWNMSSEENMLKAFIGLLQKRNPTVMIGWNSRFYDYPYITNRIIRVLDKRDDLYVYNQKKELVYNKDCLTGSWVRQLSPVNLVKHKEVETTFGKDDVFEWVGYFCEDYKDYYTKYTYTTLTSYSLESVASHELGEGKVNHDEFTDFGDFYENDFNNFIEYGIKDVAILYELNNKLKLIDLAKYISYNCGVSLNEVSGTLKQWVSYVFNIAYKEGLLLPLENQFPEIDTVLLEHVLKMPEFERTQAYKRLYNSTDEEGKHHLRGQRFPGGWTRGTAKYWKWVFSLDFTSLYPSAIMWANIGIDTLIQPKDLPQELLDLRAKYFIYYEKDIDSAELERLDYEFIESTIRNPKVKQEIHDTLVKYNVSATPNGMFFKKSERSIISSIIENLITDRKVYKKQMKTTEQIIENLKNDLLLPDSNKEDINKEIYNKQQERDMYDVFQMGVKIFLNSQYGSNSMRANVFAGHPEYFSAAITSTSRIANIYVAQEQSKKISELSGIEPKEKVYGNLNYLDNIAQGDTDSAYMSLENLIIKKFGTNYSEEVSNERLIEFTKNYITKIAMPLARTKLDEDYAYMLNAYLPDKLQEDPEIIADKFISIKPKMYFCRIFWNEGVTLSKHKLKVTGLSMIRATTPKFFRQELKHAMEILIDGDIPKVIEYINRVKVDTNKQEPSDICINQGVSSLDYNYDETVKKWRKWNGKKFLSAPVNSRASLVHNSYINIKEMSIKSIEAGDKIGFLYMIEPNPAKSNAFAFINPKVFDEGLNKFIDIDTMFQKGFMTPIKLITDPLKWDLTPQDEKIDIDEW